MPAPKASIGYAFATGCALTAAAWSAPKVTQSEAKTASPAIVLASNGAPHIQFATTNYDFGKVVVGQVVKHQFFFTNTGTAVLLIKDVVSTCGCTGSGLWSRSVEPGKTGVVPLEFFTGKFNGDVAKPITVTCNDANQPMVTLEIKGNVWRPIEVNPEAAMFSGYFEGTNTLRVLQIVNKQTQPLILSEPQSNQRSIAFELSTNRLGREYGLTVKLVPPFGTGHIFGQITMKTSAPEMPLLTVPIYAMAQPAVMALPPQIELPGGPVTNKLTRTVSFRNNASSPLELRDPAINAPGVELQLHELQKGQFYSVLLFFPPGFEIVPGQKLELTVKSNHPLFPVLRVPIVKPGLPNQAAAS